MLTVKTENKSVHWDLRQLCFLHFYVFFLCVLFQRLAAYTLEIVCPTVIILCSGLVICSGAHDTRTIMTV